MTTVEEVNMLPMEPIVGRELKVEDLVPDYCNTKDQYRWYRVVNPVCSVHPDRQATVQCGYCAKKWLSGPHSKFCSIECLIHTWDRHRGLHRHGLEGDTMQSAAENVDQWISPVNNRELLSSWKFYTPTIEDIGKVLLLECEGSILFHTRPVIPFPQGHPLRPRQMIKVNSNAGERAGSLSSPSITIVTYNVLAEVYATSEKHYHCPPLALLWEHRRENLVKEMIQYDADIVCLQEVQSDHFYAFFQPELKKLGYAGLYKQKQREWYSPTVDGCATFYRMDRFDLWESKWIKFSDYAKSLPSRFYKDNIALNVILSFKNSNQRLCIANTHIHANPNNNDVKLFQVYYLLKELESLVQKNCGIPLVICGDFNSIPGSAVHSLLTQGYVHSDHEDLNCGLYGELQPAEMFQHTLPLVSAYSSYFQCDLEQAEIARKMNDDTREPHFTNFSSDFRGTLDYILYSRTNLKVVSLLELMGEDEVENGALPSPNCPSDHIALVAKFSYIPIPKPTRENKLNSGYGPEPTKTNNLCSGDGQLQQH